MTFRVGIDQLVLGKNPPAGMNPLLLMHLAYELRSSTVDHDPIQVTLDLQPDPPWSPTYRIHDGRHRAMAALIAGVRWEIIICGSCHAVSDSQDRRRPAATCASCGAHHGDNPRTLRVVEVQIVNDQRLPQRGYKP